MLFLRRDRLAIAMIHNHGGIVMIEIFFFVADGTAGNGVCHIEVSRPKGQHQKGHDNDDGLRNGRPHESRYPRVAQGIVHPLVVEGKKKRNENKVVAS